MHQNEAVLSQRDSDGQENPIAFASRKLQPRERNYATIEKECLAALKIFYTYLYTGPDMVVYSNTHFCRLDMYIIVYRDIQIGLVYMQVNCGTKTTM